MMKLYQNRNSGFTLVEALAAAAILIILLGLSAVGVARWRDPLKITELDNAARAIYMAAENRAILLQNSGAAVSLLAVPPTPDAGDLTSSSATVTQDGKDKTVSLCVLSNATKPAILDELLPVGVIDPALREGYFYICYDKSTYHVFEVFYAEKPFSKDELDDLRGMSRSQRVSYYRKDTASRCLVGHYEGGLAGKIGAKPLPTPGVEVSITNGNELTLTVKYTIPNDLPSGVKYSPSVRLNYPGATPKQDLLSVNNSGMIIPVDGGQLIKEGNFDIAQPGDTVTYTWVLDSLEQDGGGNFTKQFKGLFVAPDTIAFGGDFTVTASLGLSADGYISSSFSPNQNIQDNSLFAKTPEGGDTNTAYIANLRHLQNLDTVCSGAAKKTMALQLKDIDCKSYTKDNGDILVSYYEFIPIENWDLMVYNACPDETAFSISHLKVTKATASTPSTGGAGNPKNSAGLFYSTKSGFEFKSVRLIDSYIEGLAQVGGLVGSASATKFTNCYLENVTVTHPSGERYWGYSGGLIGFWWIGCSEFTGCEIKNLTVESSSADAGGMAGGGPEAKFTDCTVTGGTVTGGRNVGGMLGYEDGGGTFRNCHVSGAEVICTKSAVGGTGGMVGSVKGTGSAYANFDGCTAEDVAVTGFTYAGGLVGLSATENHTDQFTNCKTLNANVIADNWNGDAGGLAGRSTGAQFKDCTTTASAVIGQYSAGGLVGNSTRGTFINCEAINATAGPTSTDGASGGLVGTTESGVTIENCRVYWSDSLWQKDQYPITGAVAGGLTGKVIDGGTIKNSFAATGVSGSIYAGGLVGQLVPTIIVDEKGDEIDDKGSIVTVATSYADCYIRTVPIHLSNGELTTWSTAGGLIGMRQRNTVKLTLSDVYAAGFITGAGEIAGGLIGGSAEGNITAQNAYTAMHYDYTATVSWGVKIYPLGAALAWGQGNNCYWLKYDGLVCENNWNSNWSKKEDMNYNQMSNLASTLGGAFTKPVETHPYWNTGTYPFPALSGLPHYGDWYQP